MAYVEPQHNAAGPTSAIRGLLMVDQGKEARPRALRPRADGTADDVSDEQTGDPVEAGASSALNTGPTASRTGLSEHTRNRIASQLRTMYDSIAQQPVPDRFADLIAKLDSGDREKA
jgi:hypothetical protein